MSEDQRNNAGCILRSLTQYSQHGKEVIMLSTLCTLNCATVASLVLLVSGCGDTTNGQSPGGNQGGSSNGSGSGGTANNSGTGGHTSTSVVVAPSLGTAKDYVILAESGISTVPPAAVTGNIGISPSAATFITGFSLSSDSTNVFSTSPQITGKAYAADYTSPTPISLTAAVSDMLLAFTDAAGRAPSVTELGAGSIGGMTLSPGVYKWATAVLISTDLTLTGSATDVWIFQIAQDLTMGSGTKIVLSGGAQPKNVFWQVAGLVELGTTAHCEGIVLTQTSITLRTGASINGRLLAQTAVNLDGSTVTQPSQ